MSRRGRNFCVTLRTETGPDGPIDFHDYAGDVQFLCIGAREQGRDAFERKSDDGWHQHAYVEFKLSQRWSFVFRLFNEPGCHIERARGTANQAITYANKEGNVFTYGRVKVRTPGRRSDLESAIALLERPGYRISELDYEMPGVAARYGRWAQRIASDVLRRRQTGPRRVSCRLFWGPTGTGKSHRAFAIGAASDGGSYVVPIQHGSSTWLDGYEGESVGIFDDFTGGIPLRTMLRLLDKWRVTGQIKGGMTYPIWDSVLITSNLEPHEWYPNAHPEQLNALMRRLETGGIEHMTEVWDDSHEPACGLCRRGECPLHPPRIP